MPTPRRRPHLATGAFFLPLAVAALAAAALSGCSFLPSKKKPAPRAEPTLIAPKHVEIGRVFSYDADDATAVVEFLPHLRAPVPAAGTPLIACRLDTLEPTARLTAAPYRNNRTLGAYVVSGRPGIDDEVVIDSESSGPGASSAPVVARPAAASQSPDE